MNKDLSEHWIDAMDMAIYSAPMTLVYRNNEQIASMWTYANELLQISNDNEDKMRFEEFKKRFVELRQQQLPLSSLNNSNRSKSIPKNVSQPVKLSYSLMNFFSLVFSNIYLRFFNVN